MASYIRNYSLPDGDRDCKRKALIRCFLQETAGSGKGDNASRYQYNVEVYKNYEVYLKRPTRLNKGFDFTVNIRGLSFKRNRRYSYPSHNDIYNALTDCRNYHPQEYNDVRVAIHKIYNCNNVDLSAINASFLDFNDVRHPIQIILLAIKWLFMEQDCAYWNYSGRKMLFDGLMGKDLI